MLITIVSTYLFGKLKEPSKIALFIVVSFNILCLFSLKVISSNIAFVVNHNLNRFSFLVPVGISFYTLQSIAFMVDVYQKKIEPEKNFFKYLLFMTFFPQVLQGPIPRYNYLKPQLFDGHKFDSDEITKGLYILLWGYIQKMVIADRCNIVVNQIFNSYTSYTGLFLMLAGILYSLQLYTDFAGCVAIATGSARIFGIQLPQNFDHPYFAVNIKDFWRRWHISLSLFLKDYVYIPLGGNRKGKARKYINLLITFFVSGLWHGIGSHFIVWGLLHGIYQVLSDVLKPVKEFLMKITGTTKESASFKWIARLVTSFFVMIAWVFFRAENTKKAIYIVVNMFKRFNIWIFTTGELDLIGISKEEWFLLFILVLFMVFIASCHEKKIVICDEILKQPIFVRFIIMLVGIFLILITGIYGPLYDSSQFIYGGF